VWLVEQGAYDAARRYVARISSGHSHPGVLRFHVAEALTAAGQYDSAIDLLGEALKIDGDRPAIHLALGQACVAAGRAHEAVPHLTVAVNAGFRMEISGPWLVRALATVDRRQEAVALLGKMPDAVAASRPDVALDLGATALDFGAAATAERWLTLATALDPAGADAHEKLGTARLLLKRPGEAVPSLETAISLDPSNASARLNLAVAYAQLGRFDDARAQAREAVRLDPHEQRAAELVKNLERQSSK
jgi:tetratricopeptide (TPR) repeat protein